MSMMWIGMFLPNGWWSWLILSLLISKQIMFVDLNCELCSVLHWRRSLWSESTWWWYEQVTVFTNLDSVVTWQNGWLWDPLSSDNNLGDLSQQLSNLSFSLILKHRKSALMKNQGYQQPCKSLCKTLPQSLPENCIIRQEIYQWRSR